MTTGTPPAEILPASQVAELINGLVKALRAFHMYLPNNPIYQRAIDNLRAAFAPMWAVARRAGAHGGRDGLRVGGAGRVSPGQQEREHGLGALVESSADPNMASSSGATPLMTAAQTGNVNVVKAPEIAAGAAVNASEGTSAQTALMWAAAQGHGAIV